MKYTKEKLVKEIAKWESEAGESFIDYFMHDNVNVLSWSFWLLGKGYISHALNIIREIEKGNTYFDQEDLFNIYPEYIREEDEEVWQENSWKKNCEIWAEFLVATDTYQEKAFEFFKTH